MDIKAIKSEKGGRLERHPFEKGLDCRRGGGFAPVCGEDDDCPSL